MLPLLWSVISQMYQGRTGVVINTPLGWPSGSFPGIFPDDNSYRIFVRNETPFHAVAGPAFAAPPDFHVRAGKSQIAPLPPLDSGRPWSAGGGQVIVEQPLGGGSRPRARWTFIAARTAPVPSPDPGTATENGRRARAPSSGPAPSLAPRTSASSSRKLARPDWPPAQRRRRRPARTGWAGPARRATLVRGQGPRAAPWPCEVCAAGKVGADLHPQRDQLGHRDARHVDDCRTRRAGPMDDDSPVAGHQRLHVRPGDIPQAQRS